MKWLICGGRFYRDEKQMFSCMEAIVNEHGRPSLIIHGGATGADTLAEKYANVTMIPTKVFPAEWTRLGRSAGFERNKEMILEEPDMVIAFPGGGGTEHMLELAKRYNVPVTQVKI